MRFSITSFASGRVALGRSSSSVSAAVRSVVMRMVLAWKNDHRFEASTLKLSAAVCALLPRVSESASTMARTEMSRAIFLLDGSMWPCPDMLNFSSEKWDARHCAQFFLRHKGDRDGAATRRLGVG